MKTLIILILCSSINIYPQKAISPSVEIFIGTVTEPGYSNPIIFYLTNQSQVWGVEYPPPVNYDNWVFYKTNDFDDPKYTVTVHNENPNYWAGLDFTASQDNSGFYDIYGYGLYKISNSAANDYFYIDYRDKRIGRYDYSTIPSAHSIDIKLKYNLLTNTYSYYNHDDSGYHDIQNNSLLKFWEIKEAGTPVTNSFPDFWQNCLVVIPSETGNHPRLVWGPYPGTDVSVAAYEIWFGTTLTANSFPVNWTKIAETGSNTFSYIHESLTLGHTQYAHYKIRTTDNATLKHYSSFSNTATIQTAEFSAEKKSTKSKINSNYYFRISNHPNPFNPTTSINYSIPEDSFTELKVYNIYGELIETLISENKTAGSYSVQFPSNGKQITSGVYLYTLSSGKYKTSGKMILLK